MCNLYTLDPVLTELAADFDKFLGRRLHLAAGADTLANQPWAKVVSFAVSAGFVRSSK